MIGGYIHHPKNTARTWSSAQISHFFMEWYIGTYKVRSDSEVSQIIWSCMNNSVTTYDRSYLALTCSTARTFPTTFHILAICVHLSWYTPATLIDRIASQSPIVLLLYNSTSYEFTHVFHSLTRNACILSRQAQIRPGLHHLSASFGSYMNHHPHPLPLNLKLRHFIGDIPSCICKPNSLPRLLKDVVAVADLRSGCRSRVAEVNSAGGTVPRTI